MTNLIGQFQTKEEAEKELKKYLEENKAQDAIAVYFEGEDLFVARQVDDKIIFTALPKSISDIMEKPLSNLLKIGEIIYTIVDSKINESKLRMVYRIKEGWFIELDTGKTYNLNDLGAVWSPNKEQIEKLI